METHLNVTDDELSNVLGGGYAVYGESSCFYPSLHSLAAATTTTAAPAPACSHTVMLMASSFIVTPLFITLLFPSPIYRIYPLSINNVLCCARCSNWQAYLRCCQRSRGRKVYLCVLLFHDRHCHCRLRDGAFPPGRSSCMALVAGKLSTSYRHSFKPRALVGGGRWRTASGSSHRRYLCYADESVHSILMTSLSLFVYCRPSSHLDSWG